MGAIIPGILATTKEDYERRLRAAESVAKLIQVDVVDGKFASNITVGLDIIKDYVTTSLLEIQLMVVKPSVWIPMAARIEYVYRILFPLETEENVMSNIELVKNAGKQVGLSINPETPVVSISKYSDYLDVLCIFSASPGFSGKTLEENVYKRIGEAKHYFPNLSIEVDIGVNFETAPKLKNAGADFLVAASALYSAPDYKIAYNKLEQATQVSNS